jgi:hypothetical protein
MGNALRWRSLLLLTGLGATAGCSQMPGGSAYAPVQLDPRLATERYLAPASDPDRVAQTRTAEAAWTKMGNGIPATYSPAAAAVTREEPVIRTSSVQMATVQQPAGPPVSAPEASTPRSLYDKQPWEVELDKTVRGICRGC